MTEEEFETNLVLLSLSIYTSNIYHTIYTNQFTNVTIAKGIGVNIHGEIVSVYSEGKSLYEGNNFAKALEAIVNILGDTS